MVRLFEIHDQKWFPQFLRDEFVDGLQMILDITNTYRPVANLLRKRLDECGAERVVDLGDEAAYVRLPLGPTYAGILNFSAD